MVTKRKIKNDLKNRRFLMLLSALLGFILWFYVLNSRPVEMEVKIPLVFIPPVGYVLAQEMPSVVTLNLKGPRAFVQSFLSRTKKIYHNLNSPLYKGRRQFNLRFYASDFTLPLGVELKRISPQSVHIMLAIKDVKEVSVIPQYVGEMAKDFRLLRTQVNPKKVKITGPASLLKNIDKIMTSPIDVSLIKKTDQIKVNLIAPYPTVKLNLSEVDLSYEVGAKKANQSISDIEIQFLSAQNNWKSKVHKARVSVLVSGVLMRRLKKEDVRIIADIPNGARGDIRVPLRAELPEGVHLLQINPPYINVKVK